MTRKVNSISFNQDNSCFITTSDNGLRVFNIDPLVSLLTITADSIGSLRLGEMLHRTNMVAVVGGGPCSKYSESSVAILDDSREEMEDKVIMTISFTQPIINLRLRMDKLIIVLRNEIHIFSSPNKMEKLGLFQTRDNPKGLCETCGNPEAQLTVFPGSKRGTIRLVDLVEVSKKQSDPSSIICAHKSELAALAVNRGASLVATASKTGTLIRIFDAHTRNQLMEFRRGADIATFHCLSFSHNSHFLCASSDKSTLHIFAVKETKFNKRSTFKRMGGLLGQYVESQWCLTSVALPPEVSSYCAFINNNSVIALCSDGSMYRHSFGLDGTISRESFNIFTDLENENDF